MDLPRHRTATSRPWAPTTPAGGSTSTTSSGACKRDKSKHDRVLEVAAKLPLARRRVAKHLRLAGMPYERALGTAFRLLDLGFFRIGGEAYAESNQSYGLATIHKEHVSLEGRSVVFDYIAKSGKERYIALGDDLVRAAVEELLARDGGGPELLAYQTEDGEWKDVSSTDINAYVKQVVGGEVSAKDFRTWHGTVIAAVALARANEKARTASARKRAVSAAMKEVSLYLGNTPSVARASYVDPRLVDLFNDGATIPPTWPARTATWPTGRRTGRSRRPCWPSSSDAEERDPQAPEVRRRLSSATRPRAAGPATRGR